MQRAEITLWVLLAATVLPAVVVAILLLPVLVLFGRGPGTTAARHLWIVMQPLVGVGAVTAGAWASRRLFRMGYTVLAFVLAAALCTGVWVLAYALATQPVL